jgi:polyisoprenoid-binding protein YceI
MTKDTLLVVALLGVAGPALAAPVTYNIDPDHTYPSFVADHMGGLSNWRGKIRKTTGTITLDREAKTGTVEITSDATTIDFGHDKMNAHAKSADIFNVEKYPTITFKGKLTDFNGDQPTKVVGDLTMKGVTKPVTLTINQFLCKPHPMRKVEVCGADASGTINRADFGVDYGLNFGFKPEVKLEIQVEALKAGDGTS